MVDVVRTPDERFAGLPGWSYEPIYTEVEADDGTSLRLARVDEGPAHGHAVVLLHGEPTWGFLWRDVLESLRANGHRVVVPDLVGFGRSDKPAERDWYSYDRLYDTLAAHLDAALQDTEVTLAVHDWGGMLGLRWAALHPQRVARLVVSNTGLYRPGQRMSDAWRTFRDFVARSETLPIDKLIDRASLTDLSDEVLRAYQAPFHEPRAYAGALALPLLVPTADDDPGAAEQHEALRRLGERQDPTLILWGAQDPIIPAKVGERLAEHIPGAGPLETVDGAHFLQEDAGAVIGERIARFIDETS